MSAITPFLFETEHMVRAVVRDGEPWFVGSDVARALEFRDAHNAIRILDDDEKGTQIVSTPGGDQELSIISESGLYALIFRSRKPAAKRFRKWVTGEVLPAIRRTGTYSAGGVATALPGRNPVVGRSAATMVNLDWAEAFLGNRELRVLGVLRGMADANGRVRSNPAQIAKAAGLSYETTDRAIMLLTCIGLTNMTYRAGLQLVPKDNVAVDIERQEGLHVLTPKPS